MIDSGKALELMIMAQFIGRYLFEYALVLAGCAFRERAVDDVFGHLILLESDELLHAYVFLHWRIML